MLINQLVHTLLSAIYITFTTFICYLTIENVHYCTTPSLQGISTSLRKCHQPRRFANVFADYVSMRELLLGVFPDHGEHT